MTKKKRQTVDELFVNKKISPKMIFDEISKTVVGQDSAKRVLSESFYVHFLRLYEYLSEGKIPKKKTNTLLMGPSGTGKTFMVREACKAMMTLTGLSIFNMIEIDCTSATPEGYVGESFSELLINNLEKLQETQDVNPALTVVFLDEFDKLCKPSASSGGDLNKSTQYNLLKIIEGTNIILSGKGGTKELDTSTILFVMAGNFVEVRKERVAANKIGLGFTPEKKRVLDLGDLHEQLENVGMITQLVGRTTHIGELTDLTELELRHILDVQVVPEYKQIFALSDKKLVVSTKQKDEIIRRTMKRQEEHRGIGARGLYADFTVVLGHKLFDLEFKI